MICDMKRIHLFFYKQPVYKQLALRRQIAKQLSGPGPFSLSNNKNYKEKWSFSSVVNVKQLSNGQYTTIQLSQKHYWKILKSLNILFGQTIL